MAQWFPLTPAIHADEFAQMSKDAPLIVLLFWAPWDPNSRDLDSRLLGVSIAFPNIRFYAVDLNDKGNWPLAVEWDIVTTPTLVCLMNGVLHERWVGLRTEAQLAAKLSEWQGLVA